jgi:hypothetical protein
LKSGVPIDVQIYFDESIDIHHIFPKKWCERNGIEAAVYNSIVNKTPISAATNRTIGGSAPSAYLKRLQARAGIDEMRMDGILRSHLIEPSLLRHDDFEGFFADRKKALIERIETVMGKPTRPEPGEATIPDTEEFEIEESS